MRERLRAGGGMLALGILAMVAASPVTWPAAVVAPALALSLAYTPGALVASRLAPRAGAAGRTLFALATAPFLTGATAALLFSLGVAPPTAARAILWAVALAALAVALVLPARGPEERDRDGAVPWLAATMWTALIAVMLLGNSWLPSRSDGAFHAAVTLQIAERSVPPEDPYFAGLRLLYFWGYHAWAALWVAITPRLTVWVPLIVLNLSGATAVMLGVCLIARRLGAGPRRMWTAAAIATLGCGPLAWVWLFARAFTGEMKGLSEMERLMTGGVSPALMTMAPWMLHSSMVFFGDKFLVLTPFALGLAQFTLLLLVLRDFLERPGVRQGLALGLVQASALFIHSVVGWSGALLAAGWWWWALWRSRRAEERRLRETLLPLIVVFAGVVVLLLPYLAATTAGKRDPVTTGMPLRALGSWLLPGMLMVPAGMVWLWQARRRVAGARDLLLFATLLTVAGLTLAMPGNNQTKFFHLLMLLLAAPAAMGLAALHGRLRGWARPLLVAALLVATLPTVAVAVWAFATERAQHGPPWEHPLPGEIEGLEWARDHTPANAVLVDSLLFLDMTVRAHRSAITGGPGWEQNWGYPRTALEVRARTARELGALRPPSGAVAEFLTDLGRPVYVVRRRRGEGWTPSIWQAQLAASHPGYRLVYLNPDIGLYQWSPVR